MGDTHPDALLFGASAAGSLIAALVLWPLARKLGVIARRGSYSRRGDTVPLLGGAALILPVVIAGTTAAIRASQTGDASSFRFLVGWLIGLAGIFVTGLIDDWIRAPTIPKLASLTVFSCIGVGAALRLPADFSALLSLSAETYAEWAGLTIFSLALLHGFRFIDSLDGLCAGLGLFAGAVLATAPGSDEAFRLPLIALSGASLGLIFLNFPPARIFVGDAGSLPIGYTLAIAAAELRFEATGGVSPISRGSIVMAVAIVLLILPIADWALTGIRRFHLKRGLFRNDWGHLHERLFQVGLPHRACTLLFWVLCLYQAGAAAMLIRVRPSLFWPGALLSLMPFAGFLLGMKVLETRLALQAAQFGKLLLKDEPLQLASFSAWIESHQSQKVPFTMVVLECRSALIELSGRPPGQTAEFYRDIFDSIRSSVRREDMVEWVSPWELAVGLSNCTPENAPIAKRLESRVIELFKRHGIFHNPERLEGWRMVDGTKDLSKIVKQKAA